MRKFLLFGFTCLVFFGVYGQKLTVKDFISAASLSPKKFHDYLRKKKFIPAGFGEKQDTMVRIYTLKSQKGKDPGSVTGHSIETYEAGKYFSFAFQTSSVSEFEKNIRGLQDAGFYCGNISDTTASDLLFQKKDISVLAKKIREEPGDSLYSLIFHQASVPGLGNIRYAEDLLRFNSHELLASVFGEKNLLKDVYYFLEKRTSKCSILFPHSSRQVVFIWKDEVNLSQLSFIIIGSNITTAGFANYEDVITENSWTTRDGIYSGMKLENLLRLNGNDFSFYGKESRFPYMVVPEKNGELDFRETRVVLGFMNPRGIDILNHPVINTGELRDKSSDVYVFMMMLMKPDAGSRDAAKNDLP